MDKSHSAKNSMRLLIVAVLAMSASSAGMSENGTILKTTALRSAPSSAAEVLLELEAMQPVQVTSRKGAWVGIDTVAGKSGWVRVLAIRTASGEQNKAGAGDLISVFKTGSTGQASSTGVKGLSAEMLIAAAANIQQEQLLSTYVSDQADAKHFAKRTQLHEASAEYVEPPKTKKKRRGSR